jgi:hypothetical protein
LTFRVFFVPLKQFLDYLELFLALKINSKKKRKKTYPTRTGWARRPDLLQPARPTRSPSGPNRPQSPGTPRPARPPPPLAPCARPHKRGGWACTLVPSCAAPSRSQPPCVETRTPRRRPGNWNPSPALTSRLPAAPPSSEPVSTTFEFPLISSTRS